jgi:hypothetical protein
MPLLCHSVRDGVNKATNASMWKRRILIANVGKSHWLSFFGGRQTKHTPLFAMVARVLFLWLLAPFAYATNNVYIAQTAQGGNTGLDCADALVYTYFNNAANWSLTPTGIQIGPDTTVHICGTLTGNTTNSQLSFQQSATSGHNTILKFEPGAVLTSPAWTFNGAISSAGFSFITVDGGTNGLITATANGSGLANQVTTTGIRMTGSHDWTVQNVTMTNLYQHTSTSDTVIDVTTAGCIYANGIGAGNVLIQNNTMSDGPWCINLLWGASASNIKILNNTMSRVPHCIAIGGSSTNTATGWTFRGNHCFNVSNWDTLTDAYHETGFHLFGNNGLSHMQNVEISSNVFDGTWSTCCQTSPIFIEAGGSDAGIIAGTAAFYNNVCNSPVTNGNGCWGIFSGTGWAIYNNTILVTSNSGSTGISYNDSFVSAASNFENNLTTGAQTFIHSRNTSWTTIDFNAYGTNGNQSSTFIGLTCAGSPFSYASFAAWATCVSGETHSFESASLNVNTSTGHLNAGSSAIGAGINLTSSCSGILANLCTDAAGNPRPSVGAWDIGAFQFSSAPPTPPAPSPLILASLPNPKILLNWEASPSQGVKYKVFRGECPNGPFARVATDVQGLSWTDKNVTPGTDYCYVNEAYYPPPCTQKCNSVFSPIAQIECCN